MHHIHNENIIHADLACRNVLISRRGTRYVGKIADFGLAHQVSGNTYEVNENVKFPIKWYRKKFTKIF